MTFADAVRSITRPALAIIGLASWVWFISESIEPPAEFKLLVGGMVASWFGERFVTRIQGK